jgi:hypothetical protein
LIEFPLRQQKSVCYFYFRIDIFVAHFAHTCILFRSHFQFSIGIRAWYTLRRLIS